MLASASLLAAVAASAVAASAPPPEPPKAGQDEAASLTLTAEQLFSFARLAEARGDVRTAEDAYEALSGDPNPELRDEARFRRARLLHAKGRLRQAAMLLRQFLDERPKAAPVRLELANCSTG